MKAWYLTTTNSVEKYLVVAEDPTSAAECVATFQRERGWSEYPVTGITLEATPWPAPSDDLSVLLMTADPVPPRSRLVTMIREILADLDATPEDLGDYENAIHRINKAINGDVGGTG